MPDRDNPFDPSAGQYPSARLVVRVRDDGAERLGVAGSRSTTFVFDASASTSANGTPLTIRWEIDDARWDPGDPDDFDLSSNEGSAILATRLTLTSAMLTASGIEGGVGEAVRDVKLRVSEGPDGPASIVIASVIVGNDAPEITAQSEDWYIAATNVPTRVTLDACGMVGMTGRCRVRDDDGDSLSFQWRQVAGANVTVSLASNGRFASFTPSSPVDPRGYIFEIDSTDGLSTRTDDLRVYANSPLWYTTEDPARLYRVYPDFHLAAQFRRAGDLALTAFANAGSALTSGAAVEPVTGEYWVSDGTGTFRLSRSLIEQQRWPVTASSIVPDGTRACVAGYHSSFGTGLYVLRANGTFVSVALPGGFGFENQVVRAGSGACWTMIQLGSGLFEIGKIDLALETYTPIATNLDPPINPGDPDARQLLVSTVDGGAWIALGSYGDPNCGGVCRIPPDATSLADLTSLDNGYAGADVIALDPDGMSVMWHRYGSPEWYHGNIGPEFSQPVVGIPETYWTYTNATDVGGKALWVTDQAGNIHRCVGMNGVFRACRSIAAGEISGLSVPSFKGLAVEPSTGNLVAVIVAYFGDLVVATVPPHLQHTVALGNPVASYSHTISADPTTGAVYYADPYIVGKVDFQKISSGGAVLSTSFAFAEGPDILRPEIVHALTDGGAWVYAPSTQSADSALVRFDTFGIEQERVPINRRLAMFGTSPDGATLCIAATGDPGNGPDQELFRYTAGTLTSLGTLRYDNDNGRQRAVVAPDGSCWFAGDIGVTVRFLRFAPGATTPAVTRDATNSVDAWRIAADPRDGSLWAASGFSTGNGSSDAMVRIGTSGALLEQYVSDLNPGGTLAWSVYAFAIRQVCPAANDPNCIEVWQLTSSSDGALFRSDGRIDRPVETLSVTGVPSAITFAP